MATAKINQANQFRAQGTATATTCSFLVNGAQSDVEVQGAAGLIGRVQNVAPGNVAKIAGLVVGTAYTYQMNPHNSPASANATVTY